MCLVTKRGPMSASMPSPVFMILAAVSVWTAACGKAKPDDAGSDSGLGDGEESPSPDGEDTAELEDSALGHIVPPVDVLGEGSIEDDCADGVDNDSNGLTDEADPGCEDIDGDGVPHRIDCDDHDPDAPSRYDDPECDGFYLAQNGVTVVCPNAPIDGSGVVGRRHYHRRDEAFVRELPDSSPSFASTCITGTVDRHLG